MQFSRVLINYLRKINSCRSLKNIFTFLQEQVIKKFPDNDTVRYTGISGFLFLRFFVPAILGPRLFDIHLGPLDHLANRTLTLISKTIQNVANIVEFGQKEPYMEPINTVIRTTIPEMKKYLDFLCSGQSSHYEDSYRNKRYNSVKIIMSDDVVAVACAELHLLLKNCMPKFMTLEVNPDLVKDLNSVLDGISNMIANEKDEDVSKVVNSTGRIIGLTPQLEESTTEENQKMKKYTDWVKKENKAKYANITALTELKQQLKAMDPASRQPTEVEIPKMDLESNTPVGSPSKAGHALSMASLDVAEVPLDAPLSLADMLSGGEAESPDRTDSSKDMRKGFWNK